MASPTAPRHGSMQYWPRVRAKKQTARVRSYPQVKEAKLLGFAGFKAGMTQVSYVDGTKTSLTKGQTIVTAATIIECPPLNVIGVRCYLKDYNGMQVTKQIMVQKIGADVAKRITAPKEPKAPNFDGITPESFDQIRLLVSTQPSLTGIGRKVADIFEIAVGGSKPDQLAFAKDRLGKQVTIQDVFAQGDLIDVHGVTRGRGTQGPVRRFGVSLRRHKSEKSIRNPGSLGPWKGQGHVMYRVAHAGKMGYHQRTEWNKKILAVGTNVSDVNPQGGIPHYGVVKNPYIIVKGSVVGPQKRLIRLAPSQRAHKKVLAEKATVETISVEPLN